MQHTFEDFLADIHAEQYTGLDDEMPEDFEQWVSEQDPWDLIEWAKKWAEVRLKEHEDA